MKGARGSGKTYQFSAIELTLFYLFDADCVNLGGSEVQAQIAYNYIDGFIHGVPEIKDDMGEWLKSFMTKKGAPPQPFIRVIPASPKAIRGPHPGAIRKAPGVILADEAAEMDDGLLYDAIPQINTANPPVLLIFSTFHNATGDYQEFWDASVDIEDYDESNPRMAGSMVRFSLDGLDINKKCTFDCSNCIEEFRKEYCKFVCECRGNLDFRVEFDPVVVDQDGDGSGKVCPKCNTQYIRKAKLDKHGWIPMEELFWAKQAFTKDKFEIEYMGYRPSIMGHVLPIDKLASLSENREFKPKNNGKILVGLDWGYAGETAIIPVFKSFDNQYYILEPVYFSQTSDTAIMDWCSSFTKLMNHYDPNIVFGCDSSHPFQNARMRDEFNLNVREVNFSKEKEVGAGVIRWLMEKDKLHFSSATESNRKLITSLKKWRRDKAGNIQKSVHDHPCDALLCALIDESLDGNLTSYTNPPNMFDNKDEFYDLYKDW